MTDPQPRGSLADYDVLCEAYEEWRANEREAKRAMDRTERSLLRMIKIAAKIDIRSQSNPDGVVAWIEHRIATYKKQWAGGFS
jgi:hypothetical protein